MSTITVIVPVYKVERYIDRCIDSILAQSFEDFDLVLVDDGSPDNCPKICDTYAEKDQRVAVIHKQNGGLSDARNAGIDWAMEYSESEWIAFVDSDDYLHADYLMTLYDTAIAESADLVICDFVRVNDYDESVEKAHSFYETVTEDKVELFEILNSGWRIDMAWNKLYAKQIFHHLRFAVGKIHEDEFAIHHVLWTCKKAAIIANTLYYYRTRENSIMATESSKSRLDEMEALIEQFEFSLERGLPTRDLLYSESFLDEFLSISPKLEKQELGRYRNLKERYKKIYFSKQSNNSFSGFAKFYLSGWYRLLLRTYRKLKTVVIRRGVQSG